MLIITLRTQSSPKELWCQKPGFCTSFNSGFFAGHEGVTAVKVPVVVVDVDYSFMLLKSWDTLCR